MNCHSSPDDDTIWKKNGNWVMYDSRIALKQ